MKIIFLQNSNIYKNKQKNEVAFHSQFNSLQRVPRKDVFISSQRKEKYAEEEMLSAIEGSENFLDESKEMLKATLAGSYFLNEARESLPLLKSGKATFEGFSERTLSKIGPKYREILKKSLEDAGITSLPALIDITQIFETLFKKQADIISHGKAIIEIYGQLENPKDIIDFPKILDEINFQNEYFNGVFDYNETINSMRFFGAKNEDDFFKKFAHLKEEFDNFETIDDRLSAFEYIKNTYLIKRDMMSFIKNAFNFLENLDVDEFYQNNADVVDYLYSHNQKNMFELLQKIMIYVGSQEQIAPHAINSISDVVNAKTPQGKIELYDFLINEQLTAKELNKLTEHTYYESINGSDVIFNRSEILDEIIDLFNANEVEARAFYACFGHILNVINKESERVFFLDPTLNLVDAIKEFDLEDDKAFLKFYLDLTNASGKQQKNKAKQQKVSPKDILNFIDLLSFCDNSMVKKYEKDKKYPLYIELKKRKVEFEKNVDKIERELKKQDAEKYFASSLEVFVDYYDLFKSSKNTQEFIAKATALQKIYLKEKMKADFSLHDTLLYHFNDKKILDEFLEKNQINLDRQSSYDITCVRILCCLFQGQNKEEIKELSSKLTQNNFIKNSRKELLKFANSKTDEELHTLFEMILNKNISSIQELNTLLKPYLGKQKQISKFLAHYKAQNLNFEDYLNKISQIQKDLTNHGFSIIINNDNIEALDLEELKGNRLNLTQACNLANKLLGVQEGNFLNGLNNSQIAIHPKYSSTQIAKEFIYSQNGRYKEEYKGFLNEFDLDARSFGVLDAGNIQYQNALQGYLKNNLSGLLNFINSDNWLYHFENNNIPNLSLHARMRLLDRFILQENKDLNTPETQEELQNILKTIYTKIPHKMEKTSTGFSLYFSHENYEIKAVFEKDGQMLTIAKNKL